MHVGGFAKEVILRLFIESFVNFFNGLPVRTTDFVVLSETVRLPLYVIRYTRIIKHWTKVICDQDDLIHIIYKGLCLDLQNGARNCA